MIVRGHTLTDNRNGIINQRPYRYRGRPGWNPAATADQAAGADLTRTCPQCHAPPGQRCRAAGSGTEFKDYQPSHSARRRAS